MTTVALFQYVVIGIVAGVSAGFFGIGGGLVIIPALVYWLGFSQHAATGTSLAVLLPPIGIAAAMEYYKQGHVNFKAALIIAFTLMLASWGSARLARRLGEMQLRMAFGFFVVTMGVYMVISSFQKMHK